MRNHIKLNLEPTSRNAEEASLKNFSIYENESKDVQIAKFKNGLSKSELNNKVWGFVNSEHDMLFCLDSLIKCWIDCKFISLLEYMSAWETVE